MDSVRAILPKVLRKRGLFTQAQASQITLAAQEWLIKAAPGLSDAIHVEKLSHAVLCLSSAHSVAAQECLPLLPSLRAFLQREFSAEAVQEIRMVRER